MLGVIKSFVLQDSPPNAKIRDRWQPGIDVPAVPGRADSGDIEIDLVELFSDVGGLAQDVSKGVAIFIDEMQDLRDEDVSALCAACHEISQNGLPVIVVDTLPADAAPSVSSETDPEIASFAWRMRLIERRHVLERLAAAGCPVVPWHGPRTLEEVVRRLALRAQLPRAGAR